MDSVAKAFARLELAVAATGRAKAAQAEQINAGWQEQQAQLEATFAEASSENSFLKEDNLRLSNQLQALQRDYLSLQEAAGTALHRLDASVKQLDVLLEH